MTTNKNLNASQPQSIPNILDTFFFFLSNEQGETTDNLSQFIESILELTEKETQKFLDHTTNQTGETLKSIAENPVVQLLKNAPGTDWLMTLLGEIDIKKTQEKVKQLQDKYPKEKSDDLAHRIIVETAWEAGKIGLITNIIPPVAIALLGLELAATIKLQAEMVYQIAAVYGLDLHEPARRGEILGIFALSLGTDVLKAGLTLVEIIPGVGAVVGASTNAIMIYGLGYTACRFYQTKFKIVSDQIISKSWQKNGDNYWQLALTQSRLMDQILVHMVVASYPHPDKSWSDILPTLKAVSPSSAKIVATHLENPQPLDELLEQLSPEFAPLLLRRCYYIAQSDGVVSHEEQKILDLIDQKFEINVDAFEHSLQYDSILKGY